MSEETTTEVTTQAVETTSTAPITESAEYKAMQAQLDAERGKLGKSVAEEKKLRERLKALEGTSDAAKTAEERLKEVEAENAEKDGKLTAADARVIRAEAKAEALRQGVKPERLQHALKLADLAGIEINENGDPDEKAIRAAIKAVVEDLPELKGPPATVGSGTTPGAGVVNTNPHANMNDAIRRSAGRT